MQLLGKGLKSIAIVTALLGMHVAIGNDVIWKNAQSTWQNSNTTC